MDKNFNANVDTDKDRYLENAQDLFIEEEEDEIDLSLGEVEQNNTSSVNIVDVEIEEEEIDLSSSNSNESYEEQEIDLLSEQEEQEIDLSSEQEEQEIDLSVEQEEEIDLSSNEEVVADYEQDEEIDLSVEEEVDLSATDSYEDIDEEIDLSASEEVVADTEEVDLSVDDDFNRIQSSVEKEDGNIDLNKFTQLSEEDKKKLLLLDSYNTSTNIMIRDEDDGSVDDMYELSVMDIQDAGKLVSKSNVDSYSISKDNRLEKGVTISESMKEVTKSLTEVSRMVTERNMTTLKKDNDDEIQLRLIEFMRENNKGIISMNRMTSVLHDVGSSTDDELKNIKEFIRVHGYNDEIKDDTDITRFRILCQLVKREMLKINEQIKRKDRVVQNMDNILNTQYFLKDIAIAGEEISRLEGIQNKPQFLSLESGTKELVTTLNPNSKDNLKIVYVDKIILSSEGERFICGNCNNENESAVTFLSMIVCSGDSGDYRASVLASPNVCHHCNAVNILSNKEIKAFGEYIPKVCDLSTNFKISGYGKIPPVNKYIPSYSNMVSLFPDLYEIDMSSVLDSVKSVLKGHVREITDSDWISAVDLYRDKIRAYAKKADLTELEESSVSFNTRRLKATDIAFKTYDSNVPINEDTKIESIMLNNADKVITTNTEKLAMVISNILSYDYNELKRYAIDSLISFLLKNNLVDELNAVNVLPSESLLKLRRYFKVSLSAIEVNDILLKLLGNNSRFEEWKRQKHTKMYENSSNPKEFELTILSSGDRIDIESLDKVIEELKDKDDIENRLNTLDDSVRKQIHSILFEDAYPCRLTMDELSNVMQGALLQCNSKIETVVNSDGSFNTDAYKQGRIDLQKAMKLSYESLIKAKRKLEILKKDRYLFSYLPINKIRFSDSWKLLYDKDIIDWIDDISNLMILNHLSESMLRYFKPVSSVLKGNDSTSYNSRLNNILQPSTDYDKAKHIKKMLDLFVKRNEKDAKTKKKVRITATNSASDLLEMSSFFLLSHTQDIESMYKIVRFSNIIKKNNIFDIAEGLIQLEDLTRHMRVIVVPHFYRLVEMLYKYIPKAKEFFNKYNNDVDGRISFYYPEFVNESKENKERLLSLLETVNCKVKVKEGQDVDDYISMVNSMNEKEISANFEITPSSGLEGIEDYYSEVFLLSSFTLLLQYNVKDLRAFLFMRDLLYIIVNLDIQTAFNILDINKDFVIFFDDTSENILDDMVKNSKADILNVSLSNFAYTSDDLNTLFTLGRESLKFKLDVLYNTGNSEEGTQSVSDGDEEAFMICLPKKERKMLSELSIN